VVGIFAYNGDESRAMSGVCFVPEILERALPEFVDEIFIDEVCNFFGALLAWFWWMKNPV